MSDNYRSRTATSRKKDDNTIAIPLIRKHTRIHRICIRACERITVVSRCDVKIYFHTSPDGYFWHTLDEYLALTIGPTWRDITERRATRTNAKRKYLMLMLLFAASAASAASLLIFPLHVYHDVLHIAILYFIQFLYNLNGRFKIMIFINFEKREKIKDRIFFVKKFRKKIFDSSLLN